MHKEQPGKAVSPQYLSYLVRLWRSTGNPEWLASLEAPGTHERHNFADLASFIAFLHAQTGTEQAIDGSSGPSETRDHINLDMEPP